MVESIKLELLRKANEVRKNSYSPYSHFQVGAALLGDDGNIYVGCNVENSSYGATICAERSALSTAISNGCNRFLAIAIVGGAESEKMSLCYPCGICRQVLSEFCDYDSFLFLFEDENNTCKTLNFRELLPNAFSL